MQSPMAPMKIGDRAEDKTKQMAKQYETVFILTPVLSDEQTREAVSGYKKLLKELNAKIVHEESWGLKKLAYAIKKKNSGDRKSTRLNSSHSDRSRMPSSA